MILIPPIFEENIIIPKLIYKINIKILINKSLLSRTPLKAISVITESICWQVSLRLIPCGFWYVWISEGNYYIEYLSKVMIWNFRFKIIHFCGKYLVPVSTVTYCGVAYDCSISLEYPLISGRELWIKICNSSTRCVTCIFDPSTLSGL